MDWYGKELASISKYCESNYYKYNDQGLRTQKTTGTCSGSKTTKYTLSGNLVIMESWGTNVNQKIYYKYDVDGSLISFKYNNNEYFYIRNLQGDIIKIIDISGNVLVTYSYDAFGNTLNTTDTSGISLSTFNPYRYRGYRYDLETGFYYLQSRYYNPQIGRFISPDSINYLNPMSNSGENLYTYTANNPVNLIDPDGNFAISLLITGFIVGALVGSTASIISQGLTKGWDNVNFWQVLLDGAIGGISGLLAFTGIGALGSAVISGSLGFIGSVGGDLISSNGNWNKVNWTKAIIMTAVNFGLGFGAGAYNSKAIGSDLWKSVSKTNVGNIFQKAVAKYSSGQITQKGLQGIMNLYGNTLAMSMTNAMPMIMANRVTNSFGSILISGGVDILAAWFLK